MTSAPPAGLARWRILPSFGVRGSPAPWSAGRLNLGSEALPQA